MCFKCGMKKIKMDQERDKATGIFNELSAIVWKNQCICFFSYPATNIHNSSFPEIMHKNITPYLVRFDQTMVRSSCVACLDFFNRACKTLEINYFHRK